MGSFQVGRGEIKWRKLGGGKKTAKKNIHIHNDIFNTAHHLKARIEEMEATGNRQGIALDITACLVM